MPGQFIDAPAPATNAPATGQFIDAPAPPPSDFHSWVTKQHPLASIGGALNAQLQGTGKALTGESDIGAQDEAIWKKLGVDRSQEPGWWKGLTNFGLDMVRDPVTYETLGLGTVVPRIAKAVGGAFAPALRADAEMTAEWIKAHPKEATSIAGRQQAAKKVGNSVHDFFTFGGEAKREHGVPRVQQMLGAEQRIDETRARLERKLNAHVERAFKGLTPQETANVMNARQNFLADFELTGKEKDALKLLNGWQQRMFRLSKAAERLAVPGEMPRVTELEGWLPLPVSEADKALGMPARTFNKLEGVDPHLLERRGPSRPLTAADVPGTLEAIKSANRSKGSLLAGKALAQDVRKVVPALAGVKAEHMPEHIRKLFEVQQPATGQQMTGADHLRAAWKGLISAPKTAVVGVTPGHVANMASPLGGMAAAQPGGYRAIGASIKNFPKNYRDVVTEGEKTTPLIESALKHPLTRPVGKYMSAVNHATWAVDKGLMDEFARQFTAKGMHPDQARQVARETMVDYEHLSPFAQKLKAIMPFGSWNTSIWKQIVNGVIKDPVRAAAINRATGGYFYGDDVDTNGPLGKLRSLLPAAEVGRAVGDPHEFAKFARKSLAVPVDAALGFAEKAARPGTKYPFTTYGLDPTNPQDAAKIAAQVITMGVPEASTALGAAGFGPFKPDSLLSEALRQGTRTLPLSK